MAFTLICTDFFRDFFKLTQHTYMLTNQQFACNTSWTINDLNEGNQQHASRVIRKYINSAIYVEKEVAEMLPQRKTSCLLDQENPKDYGQYNSNENKRLNDGSHKTLKNTLKLENNQKTSPESGYRTTGQSEQSENSYMSGSTVKPSSLTNFNNELKLSLTCLNTDRTSTLDPREKEEIVQNWLTKKERQQKRKALKEAREAKRKEEERLLLIEKERENFKRWLAEKKKEEEQKKAQKELEEQQEKLKEAEKERQKIENEIKFNHWLRRKRKDDLGK